MFCRVSTFADLAVITLTLVYVHCIAKIFFSFLLCKCFKLHVLKFILQSNCMHTVVLQEWLKVCFPL